MIGFKNITYTVTFTLRPHHLSHPSCYPSFIHSAFQDFDMNPLQRNKIDISKLNPQEQQLLAKYGKLPTHKNVLMKMQKDRKYFDSGDYALSKAGKAPQSTVGTAIPNPENIPHASTPTNGHSNCHPTLSISPTNSTSPMLTKESGLATDENTTPPVDTQDDGDVSMSSDADAPEDTAATTTSAEQTASLDTTSESAIPIAAKRPTSDTTPVSK